MMIFTRRNVISFLLDAYDAKFETADNSGSVESNEVEKFSSIHISDSINISI